MPTTTAQDEFVDLYALLDLPMEADASRIRKRVSELYLEAQKNLDHRNARKRLQYQQMYEVYLPQARHLLLEPAHRAEYDQYLKAFLSGGQVAVETKSTTAPTPVSEPTRKAEPDLPGASPEPEELPQLTEAEQANVWSKWKQGLQSTLQEEVQAEPEKDEPRPAAKSTPAATTAAPAPAAATPPTSSRPAAQATAPRPAPRPAGAKPMPRVAGAPPADEESEEEKRKKEAAEFQRQQARIHLIRTAVQTAGLVWRIAAGIGAFVIGCLLVFGIDSFLHARDGYPMGLSRGSFSGLGLFVVLCIAVVVSHYVSRRVRRQKNMELSLLSYEELRRRTG